MSASCILFDANSRKTFTTVEAVKALAEMGEHWFEVAYASDLSGVGQAVALFTAKNLQRFAPTVAIDASKKSYTLPVLRAPSRDDYTGFELDPDFYDTFIQTSLGPHKVQASRYDLTGLAHLLVRLGWKGNAAYWQNGWEGRWNDDTVRLVVAPARSMILECIRLANKVDRAPSARLVLVENRQFVPDPESP